MILAPRGVAAEVPLSLSPSPIEALRIIFTFIRTKLAFHESWKTRQRLATRNFPLLRPQTHGQTDDRVTEVPCELFAFTKIIHSPFVFAVQVRLLCFALLPLRKTTMTLFYCLLSRWWWSGRESDFFTHSPTYSVAPIAGQMITQLCL